MQSFIFGKNTPWTYEELQRKRAIADKLVEANSSTPRNVGEGLASIGRALAFRSIDKRAGKRDAELKGEYGTQRDRVMAALMGGGEGGGYGGSGSAPSGTWTPAQPAPKATETWLGKPDVAKGGLSFDRPKADAGVASGGLDYGANVMTPQEMLVAGAKARGLDPIDVATAISYETGGKFDPMLSGPTTQWGTHRGLIQFGEPQAADNGVDFSDPDSAWRSQLDPNSGAVWKYLEGAGVKPGMGLPEVYSAINAGAVGRMGASDANNGGAPGTVADKVAGMGDHRANAAKFLGGTWTPSSGGSSASDGNGPVLSAPMGQGNLAEIAELLASPYASPGDKAILGSIMQQQMQAMDPMAQMEAEGARVDLEKSKIELAQMQNPQADIPKTLSERKALAAEAGLQPGTPEYQGYIATGELAIPGGGTEYGLTPILGRDAEGKPVILQIGKDGTSVVTKTPEGVTPDLGLAPMVKAEGAAIGKAAGEANVAADSLESKMPGLEGVVQQLETLADEATYTMAGQGLDAVRKQFGMQPRDAAVARAEYIATVDNQVLPLLRDTFGAAFTVKEGETLRATLGDPNKSPEEKKAVLRAFIEQKKRDYVALQQQAGNGARAPEAGAPAAETFEAFSANPSAIAAAKRAGVTLEEMWAIKQGLQ